MPPWYIACLQCCWRCAAAAVFRICNYCSATVQCGRQNTATRVFFLRLLTVQGPGLLFTKQAVCVWCCWAGYCGCEDIVRAAAKQHQQHMWAGAVSMTSMRKQEHHTVYHVETEHNGMLGYLTSCRLCVSSHKQSSSSTVSSNNCVAQWR